MVSPCTKAAQEVDRVVQQISKLLIEMPHGLEDPVKLCQYKLTFLLKQLEHHKPYFTAKGVFEINYSMFMYILSGIISFVVVYVQEYKS